MNPISNIFVASLMVFAALYATPAASNSSSMRGIGDSCSDTGLINADLLASCCTVQSCCVNVAGAIFNCGNKNNLLNSTSVGVFGGAVTDALSGLCGEEEQAVCAAAGKQCFNVIPVTTSAVGAAFNTCCASAGAGNPTDCGNNVQCNQENTAGTYFACCNSGCS